MPTPTMAEVLRREQGAIPKGGKEVIDRATFLPVGQYEDGSLTFAWPGFLKDAWEGGQRTFLDSARVPVPDAAPGTKWSSNVDALNATSISPMAGVAWRAAGAVPRGALGSGGSDTIRRAAAGSAEEAGRLSGALAPTDMPAPRSGAGQPGHSQPQSQGPQGPGSHTTTTSDPLSGSFNASLEEIELLRSAYHSRSDIPSGWYVHGRQGMDRLRDDVEIQATRDFDVMEQYGKDGSGWAIKPLPDATVLDFRSIETPDARRVGALAMRDYRAGLFPDDPYEKLSPRELSERFRGHYAPDDIVATAAGYDSTDLINWLLDRVEPRPQFVLTPDGAVALDKDAISAVRLFANDSRAALPGLVMSGEDENKPTMSSILRRQ